MWLFGSWLSKYEWGACVLEVLVTLTSMTIIPLVDLRDVGYDVTCSAIGIVSGSDASEAGEIGAAVSPLGWVITIAIVLAGAFFAASIYRQPRLLWVGFGFGALAFATAVAMLIEPTAAVGNVLTTYRLVAVDTGLVVDQTPLWLTAAASAFFMYECLQRHWRNRKPVDD